MAAEESDLWPTDLVVDVLSPAMILNEQAEALSKRTQGIVRGEVIPGNAGEFEQLALDLYAPAVGFRHQLLQIRHRKDYPYPCVVLAAPLYRYSKSLLATSQDDFAKKEQWELTDEEQDRARCADTPNNLQAILRIVFSANTTKSTLFSLIARSNEVTGARRNRPQGAQEAIESNPV